MESTQLSTPYEAGYRLGRAPATIKAWIRSGALPAHTGPNGKLVQIHEKDLQAFAKAQGISIDQEEAAPAQKPRHPNIELQQIRNRLDELESVVRRLTVEANAVLSMTGQLREAVTRAETPEEHS